MHEILGLDDAVISKIVLSSTLHRDLVMYQFNTALEQIFFPSPHFFNYKFLKKCAFKQKLKFNKFDLKLFYKLIIYFYHLAFSVLRIMYHASELIQYTQGCLQMISKRQNHVWHKIQDIFQNFYYCTKTNFINQIIAYIDLLLRIFKCILLRICKYCV